MKRGCCAIIQAVALVVAGLNAGEGRDLTVQEVNTIKQYVLRSKKTLEGWCSDEKGQAIIDLIAEVKPDVCVEIGVFGGASIFPMAMTLKAIGKGHIYAIDPWSTDESVKGQDTVNADWWASVDHNYVYKAYKKMLSRHFLEKYVTTYPTTSEEAVSKIPDEIDILHIDGNHSTDAVLQDVTLYFPKVKSGGYIWCDDWNWQINGEFSARKGYELMLDECEFVLAVDDCNCVLLRKL